jgi:glycosyltransferase involved in cell wall biosynthesis
MDLSKLKICFLAGTLGQGGAEKQLFYVARALKTAGVDVQVCCSYRGEYYEPAFRAENIPVVWLGWSSNPAVRLVQLATYLVRFRPHVIQAAHFHMNIHANVLGRLLGAVSISSSRSDVYREIRVCKPWGIWGVRTAATLAANSKASRDKAIELGVPLGKLVVLSNVIDLEEFDKKSMDNAGGLAPPGAMRAVAVGTMCRAKRFDRFLRALASARVHEPKLQGLLVGDGPDREDLHALATSLGLGKGECLFPGRRDDVPALLKRASVFVLSSESEGFPNVLLEAMAARLPIVTTPAGDAAELVKAAEAGFVVDHDDISGMASCLGQLAKSRELRTRFGNSGRSYVERHHSASTLGRTLLDTYQVIAERQGARQILELLNRPVGI